MVGLEFRMRVGDGVRIRFRVRAKFKCRAMDSSKDSEVNSNGSLGIRLG